MDQRLVPCRLLPAARCCRWRCAQSSRTRLFLRSLRARSAKESSARRILPLYRSVLLPLHRRHARQRRNHYRHQPSRVPLCEGHSKPRVGTEMKLSIRVRIPTCPAFIIVIASVLAIAQVDPLPSWNDTASKKAIFDFVERITKEGGPEFVPVNERIATFDNDGTLWVEQPMYTQFVFALDRVRALAPQHPEWKTEQPFKAALEGDQKTLLASGEA